MYTFAQSSPSQETLISSYACKQALALHRFFNHTYKNILSCTIKVLMFQSNVTLFLCINICQNSVFSDKIVEKLKLIKDKLKIHTTCQHNKNKRNITINTDVSGYRISFNILQGNNLYRLNDCDSIMTTLQMENMQKQKSGMAFQTQKKMF